MSILGIDPSLTSTGWCIKNGNYITGTIKPKKMRGVKRLKYIRDEIKKIIKANKVDFIIIEGYSFGSRGGRAFSIGELGGVLKLFFKELKINFIIVQPTAVKKFATGKGNEKKEKLMLFAYKKYGFEFKNNDECDAFWITKIGEAYKTDKIKYKYQKAVLDKIKKRNKNGI